MTPMEERQERRERMYEREDAELAEQIATERFAEHRTTKTEDAKVSEIIEATIEPDEAIQQTDEKPARKRRERTVTVPAGLIMQQEPPEPETPTTLVRLAVQQNFDLDKLERLLQLQREWQRDEARRAFFAALSRFQSELPPICRSGKVDAGRAGRRRYASLGTINEAIRPYLYSNGLSFRFSQKQSPEGIAVTCIVSHRDGHSEDTTLMAGADVSGGKNAIQSVGSTITYLERYTLTAALGLTTVEDDDDGEQGHAAEVHATPAERQKTALELAAAAAGVAPPATAPPAPAEQPATATTAATTAAAKVLITNSQKIEMRALMRELFASGVAAKEWLLEAAGTNDPAELLETEAMGVLSKLYALKHARMTPPPLTEPDANTTEKTPEQTGRATAEQREEIKRLTFELYGDGGAPEMQGAWLQSLGYSSVQSLTWMQAADRLAVLRRLAIPIADTDGEQPPF
jgi:hypothetical protein